MSVRAYPAYRESGVDWIGLLPCGWEMKRVKHVTRSIEQGWSPQCDGYPVSSPEEWGVLKVGCVNGGQFNPEENKSLPNDLKPIPELGIAAGDVLVSRANTRELVGGAACVSADHPNLLLCDKLYRLRLEEKLCLPKWLAMYLRSGAARGQIELAASGASQSMLNIGQGTILDLPIPLPKHDEQAAILVFLDRETGKIDALVAEQERLIALLKEKRQAVISQAVTKGLDPNVPMKDSGVEWLGEVPAHWEVLPMKRFLHEPLMYGANQASDDDTPGNPRFVRITDVADDGSLREDTFRSLPPAVAAQYLLSDGDILLARSGATVGKSFKYRESWGTCCFAGYLIRARFDTKRLTSDFVDYLCSSKIYWAYVQAEQIQATIPNISAERYGEMQFPCPPTYEQVGICSYLNSEAAKIGTLAAEAARAILLLRERRAALISAAVTGKIDVRDHAATGQATAA